MSKAQPLSILEQLQAAPVSSFHVLESEKAKRMKARTMFVPAPDDVAKVILAIPKGKTKTMLEIRQQLSELHQAETTCPFMTTRYWKWLARATEEAPETYQIPWWRVLKEGKPSLENQKALLEAEGTIV